jgi:hypothetical protein
MLPHKKPIKEDILEFSRLMHSTSNTQLVCKVPPPLPLPIFLSPWFCVCFAPSFRKPKSLKLFYSIMNLNTISLALVGKAKNGCVLHT